MVKKASHPFFYTAHNVFLIYIPLPFGFYFPPVPPPQFYYFPSATTTATFLLFSEFPPTTTTTATYCDTAIPYRIADY